MSTRVSRKNRTPRERRKIAVRKRITGSDERPRLSVFRSAKHTYAQVISDVDGKVIVSASTQQEGVLSAVAEVASKEENKGRSKSSKSQSAAQAVGLTVAKLCKSKNIEAVVFDRNGYLYHGRVKAVADGARQGGLKF